MFCRGSGLSFLELFCILVTYLRGLKGSQLLTIFLLLFEIVLLVCLICDKKAIIDRDMEIVNSRECVSLNC